MPPRTKATPDDAVNAKPADDVAPATNLGEALARVQANLPHITKGKTAKVKSDRAEYSYKYADLADVSAAILPLLGAQGLAWITRPTLTAAGTYALHYELRHAASDQTLEGLWPLPMPGPGNAQAVGSAITYARRYTLCCVTGVVPDEDDDGRVDQIGGQQQRSTPRDRGPSAADEAHAARVGRRLQEQAETSQVPTAEQREAAADRFLELVMAAWDDLDLDALTVLYRTAPDMGVTATQQVAHPISGEVMSLKDVIASVGRDIRAGTKPPTPDEPGDAALPADAVPPSPPAERLNPDQLAAQDDPWQTPNPPLDVVDGVVVEDPSA